MSLQVYGKDGSYKGHTQTIMPGQPWQKHRPGPGAGMPPPMMPMKPPAPQAMPAPQPLQLPKARPDAAAPNSQYAANTLMKMYDVPPGFHPDPTAQANCPPERPYCNPIFVNEYGQIWKPGEPMPAPPAGASESGAQPYADYVNSPEMQAERQRRLMLARNGA